MKLAWTRAAWADRKAIREYIAHDNLTAAIALDELLSKEASRLIDHPGIGRPGRVTGTRELIAHQNYILIYDSRDDVVRVLRVLHAARQWPPCRPRYSAGELLATSYDSQPQPPEEREWLGVRVAGIR